MARYHGPNQGARTFTREQLDEAQAAWAAGDYRPEFWAEWRKIAAAAGIIVPPVGHRLDGYGDEDPSERALIARAIEDSASLLRSILSGGRVHSWAQVVRLLVQDRDRMADEAEQADELEAARHRELQPTRGEATEALRSILGRIR